MGNRTTAFMHNIEPHFNWRTEYAAEDDPRSPFFGRDYSEQEEPPRLYNFYLNPEWDNFGSSTLYGKLLYADYNEGCALIELIGEWNDVLHNDIMCLKRYVVDPLMDEGIVKFALFCDNVLFFHADSDDDYYAEWYETVSEEGGWIALINTRQHVYEELEEANLDRYLLFGEDWNGLNWRVQKPLATCKVIDGIVNRRGKRLY
jgi:hypothetical protein